ncbi:putative protein phosphatase 2C 51 [Acorus calamus]|uniref:protein-serine/threonine phosphatase n=1 Tax=Acorus calamus TaxID=4465 RepID=A0AAV9F790_ACOCL|nr:putative protein phosphatase 2C 51 [Acorus calamus]
MDGNVPCLSHGSASACGRRREMEDAVAVRPALIGELQPAAEVYDFFGINDRHGGDMVARACRERFHVAGRGGGHMESRLFIRVSYKQCRIEVGFQIFGEAIPRSTLRACGYPTYGTSLCIFQWVRHHYNGTPQYVEGATNPEHVVTADDVGATISVECIPMDDRDSAPFINQNWFE